MLRLMTSADRRLAAISNVVRVRVEFSKNRLNTALPRSNGTFFTSRSEIDTNGSAVSRMCVMMSAAILRASAGASARRAVELRVAQRAHCDAARGSTASDSVPPGSRDSTIDKSRGTSIARAGSTSARSAARVRRGRSSTASSMRSGRPKSNSSLIAARTLRPVYSTSSTRTIVAPSTSNGSVVRLCWA